MSRLWAEVYPANSGLRRLAAALIFVTILSASLFAENGTPVPPMVKFSGTISGGTISGAPSGTVGVLFALYKDQTGGAPLWQEVQNITVDAVGHYTAFLGARSPNGLPVDIFSSGDAHWLAILPAGQSEQPRVLLVSVPYALKAADAETLGGLPASAFLRADSVPAQPSASYTNAAVMNAASARIGSTPALSAPGAVAGYLPMFTDTGGDLSNSVLFQAGGNIGIGTTAPSYNLNVVSQTDPAAIAIDGYGIVGINFIGRRARGTLAAPSALQSDDNIFAMQGRGFGTAAFSPYSRASMKFFAAENWSDTQQGTYITLATTPKGTSPNASASEVVRITDAGAMGIGTSTPDQKLTVAGAIHSTVGGFVFPDGTTQTTAQAANLTAISLQLGTNGYNGSNFKYAATCMIGDIILSTNAYGGGGAAIPADGSLLLISANPVLFNVLGTTFGGNGTTNFGVPDLRHFAPQGLQYSICVQGIYPSRN
jgi:hypothetical protein